LNLSLAAPTSDLRPTIVRRSSSFIEQCLPSKMDRPPSGPLWIDEITAKLHQRRSRRCERSVALQAFSFAVVWLPQRPVTVLSKTAMLVQVQQIVASPLSGEPDPRISVALS